MPIQSETEPPLRNADEFPADAMHWPSELSRREFLQRLGASLALAGVGGCARRAADQLVSRVAPDRIPEADSQTFATAMAIEGYARGILVSSHDGRPTKIEGNPDHPESLGATDVFTQAAILSLYDPDRSRMPHRSGLPATWTAFENEWLALRRELLERRGEGLALLTEPTTSPTLQREMHRVLDLFPAARWFQHTPLVRYDHRAAQPDFDFSTAEVILSVGSDCFYRHPSALRYARAFASRRRVEHGRVQPPRFYALEPTPSVTGALADFRLAVSPQRVRTLLELVEAEVTSRSTAKTALSDEEQRFIRGLAGDILAHSGRVVCVAGPESGRDVLGWAAALNARFGSSVTRHLAVLRSDADERSAGDLTTLADAMTRKEVRALFVLGSNPAYTAPADLEFRRRLREVPFAAHLGEYRDETAALARWHLPESHFLETWSDLRAYSGAATIQQPVIEPFGESRSIAEILRFISAPSGTRGYDLVRETWREALGSDRDFDARWHQWLNRGVVDLESPTTLAPPRAPVDFPRWLEDARPDRLTIVFQPDSNVLDGRFANNAWLQELPKPLTQLVWDNAALVSPKLARELGLANGDLVSCEAGGAAIEAPVWIMPGQAASVVTLSLGYGRTHAGIVGNAAGYDAYRARISTALWQRDGATLRKIGRRHALISTQQHFALEGRDLVRVVTPGSIAHSAESSMAPSSLYASWPRDRYAWGMSIDLATCLGCNACIVACQAENNIPVVGKDQVARGREMHWLRVDRYYSGDAENPRFLHQPVPCMHCENAPCEIVCPVAATVHSSEGLNDMVYNRCIGTRYCSNNCPYKVRRFNFLDYRAAADSPLYLQANPSVTVRERGVMEKCTYCVQRINAARIAADRENRAIRDGEIRTACQQACPAEAIVFGDLNDAASRVSRRKAEPTSYALLAELNTRPRTTYLAAVRHEDMT